MERNWCELIEEFKFLLKQSFNLKTWSRYSASFGLKAVFFYFFYHCQIGIWDMHDFLIPNTLKKTVFGPFLTTVGLKDRLCVCVCLFVSWPIGSRSGTIVWEGYPPVRAETMGGCTAHTCTRFPVKVCAGGVYKVCEENMCTFLGLL